MTTPKAPFDWTLTGGDTRAEITLPQATVRLTAPELEMVIYWLSHVRQKMTPPVPADPMSSQSFPPITQYRVAHAVAAPAVTAGCTMYLRSPFLGWFAMQINAAEAQNMIALLTIDPDPSLIPTKN